MFTRNLFEMALNIVEPWYIKDIQFSAEEKRLDIHVDFRKGSLFHYESAQENIGGDFKAYDSVIKEWRHLNFFEHECVLHARVPRLDIDGSTKRLLDVPWAGLCNGFTMLFEALILQLAKHMPVHTVAKIVGESDYKIWSMLENYVNKALGENDYSDLKLVGMDETSRRKGHDYRTLFVDLLKKRTVFIAPGKDHETVRSFALDLKAHQGNPEAITDVSCDMSPAFIKGVAQNLPNAKITFDRKREQLSMSKLNLKSIKALHIRESFQIIYKAATPQRFACKLKEWYFWATHSRIRPIIAAARTIRAHWQGVLQWKNSLLSNGLLEGLNSLIQAAKAKARGFTTLRYFRIIAFLITGHLDFSKFNKHYRPT